GFGAGGPGAAWTRRAGPGGFEHYEFSGGAPGGPGGAGFDASDLFSELFGGLGGQARRGGGARAGTRSGGQQVPRGEDVTAQVTVTLAEAAHGAKVRVTLPTDRTLEVTVPAGIEDGKQIRLKGQGMASPFGGEPGDVLIAVKIARHPYFRVDGHDLRLDLPVTLYEAVLGAKVNVPTLDGMVELNVPTGTNGGRTLRLRGKGLPGTPAGDLLVTLRIMLPDNPDADLISLMREWQTQKPYDPRKDLK
ncbi:MAG TPA: J domain-containing protein, partial [Methylovirgula sp.]